jgi:very-short-patch-repair endonuclease
MSEYFNHRSQKDKRRQLRSTMPKAEVILWERIRRRQMLGCKFRHQYSVGSYVIDFFSAEIRLGIELDGDSHFESGAPEYDQKRKQFIESFGIRTIRILNRDVYENLDAVLVAIEREVTCRRESAM